jgi:hypothetical protein
MVSRKSKKVSRSRKATSKAGAALSLAAVSDGELEPYLAAKEKMYEELFEPTRVETFRAMSAATSPAPEDNLSGIAIGEKIVAGKYTGILAVKFLVRFKYSEDRISPSNRLSESVNGLPTDVVEVGTFRRFEASLPLTAPPNPRTKIRPAPPGCSVGFRDPANQFRMAGTFGALVKRGERRFILSNNHVLADENRLPINSPIFQPGLLDGGNPSTDQIARLSAFVQLQVAAANQVDAAIAEADNASLVTNSILMLGAPQGTTPARRDMIVEKFGRTTDFTVGRITSINADVRVNYDLGTLIFRNQITIRGLNGQLFSDSGDSGSLIVERSARRAVGLLFAGSRTETIANHIGDVFQSLNVRLA